MGNQNISIVESIAKRLESQINRASKIVVHSESEIIISTSTGVVREQNEDRVVFALIKNQARSGINLAVGAIADGMGGLKRGGDAASITIAGFLSYLSTGESERSLVDLCGRAVKYAHELTINKLGLNSGSTLSALVYGVNGCAGVNVGDSRIYRYNMFEGVKQITVDDTIAAQVEGVIDDDDWSIPNGRDNRLIQHIGMEGNLEPHIKIVSIPDSQNIAKCGYLLTSDGLHYIGKKMIDRIVKNSSSGNDISNKLTSIAEWLSGHDNMSLAVLPAKINLISSSDEGQDTEINVFSPNAEFELILLKQPNLIEPQKAFIGQQKKLFNEIQVEPKPMETEASEKIEVITKTSNRKKKKTGAKNKLKKINKNMVADKNIEAKTASESKEKNLEVIIDYVTDDESGDDK